MQIRFAQAKDVPGILALLRQAGQRNREGRPDLFRAGAQKYGASQLLAMLNVSRTPVFVAVEGDAVLGCGFCSVTAHTEDPTFTEHATLHIDDLCVDEVHRGQQIGTALYQEILRYARIRRCHNVTLNVWRGNEAALRFAEGCGMKPQKICMETVLEEG